MEAGKEIWMTEYLINWNEGKSDAQKRDFDFKKDFFDFFRAINTCMLGDFNAWVHYAAKRYYGLLGDGTTGAGKSGEVTKRGYIMAHFAQFVTGMTRIDIDFGKTKLEGSAYLSVTGDSVAAVMANATNDDITIATDLPFSTRKGQLYSTTQSDDMKVTTLTPDSETSSPTITVPAQSVSTILFVRSGQTGMATIKNDQNTTTETYDLSGRTVPATELKPGLYIRNGKKIVVR
jgi:glucuronoarabinoxylan endo-1,4-beta-xylanase